MGFPFTIVVGFPFTIVLGIQLTISSNLDLLVVDLKKTSLSEVLEWNCEIYEEIGISEQEQQDSSVEDSFEIPALSSKDA